MAAFACSLALASPGAATSFFLKSDSMNTSRTAVISGPGFNANVYVGPVKFKVYEGTGSTPATGALSDEFELLGFCVDIYHGISLGMLNLKYDDNFDLTTNSKYLTNTPFAPGATPLSHGQIVQIGKLVNYGTAVYYNAPNTTDTVNRLAGLQGAIWKVANPGFNVVSGNAGVNSYINTYSGVNYAASLTGYGPVRSNILFLTETGKYGTKSAHQSFAFGAVPEPQTWALTIVGFGMIGATLRRSRQRVAAVPA